MEKLAKLPPVFREGRPSDRGECVPAERRRRGDGRHVGESRDRHGVTPLARIVDYGTVGVKPEAVMEAPIAGVRKLLKKTGLSIDEIDLFEHNEAYAARASR